MRKLFGIVAGVFGVVFAAAAQPVARQTQDQIIRKALDVSSYSLQEFAAPAAPGPFGISVQLGASVYDVMLEPSSVRAEGFKVMVQGADGALTEVAPPPENTFRGWAEQSPGSVAAASVYGTQIRALIRLGGEAGTWAIEPLSAIVPGAPASAHVVYAESAWSGPQYTCGLRDDAEPAAGHGHGSPDMPLVAEIACDADFEFYQQNGSNVTNTTNDVTLIINNMSAIYNNDCQITFEITQIIVRSSAASNPYTTSVAQDLLGQFRSYWLSNHAGVPRDLAHLFTGRNLSGSTIGIAYLNGVCNSNAFGLSQSRYTTNVAFRTGLTAHEVGHNFSAPHCDTICSPCKIMCSGLGGCSGSVTSFSTCDIASITGYAAGRPCLSPPVPPVLALPFFEPWPGQIIDPLKWQNNTGAGVSPFSSNPRSAPNALAFFATSAIETKDMDTATPNVPIFVSFWTQPKDAEAGETLTVSYWIDFANLFNTLKVVVSDGTNPSRFMYHEVKLPLDGLSSTKSRLKFASNGNNIDDTWFLDDVSVSIYCRADVNKDRQLNLADFGAFQTAFATNNLLIADMNDDGLLNLADFGAFQTRYALGCY